MTPFSCPQYLILMTPKGTAHGFLAFIWLVWLYIADNDSGELSMTTTRPLLQVETLSSEFSITAACFSITFSLLEEKTTDV